MRKLFIMVLVIFLFGCTQTSEVVNTATTSPTVIRTQAKTSTPNSSSSPTSSVTPTPQAHLQRQAFGIEIEDFPKSYNPLTALEVPEPALLDLPAVLISISNIPTIQRVRKRALAVHRGFLSIIFARQPRAFWVFSTASIRTAWQT